MSRSVLAVLLPLCVFVIGGGVSCASRSVLTSAGVPPANLNNLPPVARLALAASDEFHSQQNGSGFATDLACNACTASGSDALFAPQSATAGSCALSDTAYCLYRLTLSATQSQATLTLDWDGTAPQDCWIGLTYWQGAHWSWAKLPESSELVLYMPSWFSDASQRCYVTVVVTGSTPCSLATIGFGPETPPNGDGYTLFAPYMGYKTLLIDMDGTVAHTWTHKNRSSFAPLLMENGHLLRTGAVSNPAFGGGGVSGLVSELDWDSNVIWSYKLSTATQVMHHDIRLLPNGNVLVIVWHVYTTEECIAMGRDPATVFSSGLWIDEFLELEPIGSEGANIVWQWRTIDHLVQDVNPELPNYGDPLAHPELVDINYDDADMATDWMHTNGIYYNAELDQMIVSVHEFSEFWVIDHSTTLEESAGHTGGRYGKGGDLLYRWGNPEAYRAGTTTDRQLFLQHDAHWIEDGLEGAGNILVYNNQAGIPTGETYSTVVEITPPVNPDGSYYLDGAAYGPATPTWTYKADPADTFYSPNISSAQRLPGGNTLICCGSSGWFFEVTPAGEKVWEYYYDPVGFLVQVCRCVRYPYSYPGVAALADG